MGPSRERVARIHSPFKQSRGGGWVSGGIEQKEKTYRHGQQCGDCWGGRGKGEKQEGKGG